MTSKGAQKGDFDEDFRRLLDSGHFSQQLGVLSQNFTTHPSCYLLHKIYLSQYKDWTSEVLNQFKQDLQSAGIEVLEFNTGLRFSNQFANCNQHFKKANKFIILATESLKSAEDNLNLELGEEVVLLKDRLKDMPAEQRSSAVLPILLSGNFDSFPTSLIHLCRDKLISAGRVSYFDMLRDTLKFCYNIPKENPRFDQAWSELMATVQNFSSELRS